MAAQEQKLAPRKRLADLVFERMLRSIKSGAYEADERLPTEHELAAEFQVSRPVVRDALKRLRDQGFVYSRQGSGSFVRRFGLKEPLGFGQVENISHLQQCYEFRLTLEPEAAAQAAERHDAQSLQAIQDALELMRDATNRHRHREDADYMFHLAIARASRNQYFAKAMEALKDHIAVGMQFHGLSLKLTAHGLREVFEEHNAIFEAIRDRKPDLARAQMRSHLSGSRDRLFEGRRHPADPVASAGE
ncbi:FadR/GntR family transcriptional regulator [Inquilinus limosus]|uniref:FadR/GntR family transcriptional regulator n=1 Tax=Inquilinus limosus TaxID=171674 RepID=UPI003F5CD813